MSTTVMAVQQPSPLEIMSQAVIAGKVDIDVVRELAKMHYDSLQYEAKVAFNEALHRVQGKCRRIGVDAVNPQTKSKYATYAKLDGALRPLYTAEEFSLSFNTADSPLEAHVRVLCDVSRGGYVKTYQIDMPADGKGAKGGDVMTLTHAMGSGVSYGMRYLLKMIFNVAIGETDDDGLAPNATAEVVKDILAAKDQDELKQMFGDAYKLAAKRPDAQKEFKSAYEKRKAELAAA